MCDVGHARSWSRSGRLHHLSLERENRHHNHERERNAITTIGQRGRDSRHHPQGVDHAVDNASRIYPPISLVPVFPAHFISTRISIIAYLSAHFISTRIIPYCDVSRAPRGPRNSVFFACGSLVCWNARADSRLQRACWAIGVPTRTH
jgi:hypothetical protein